MKLRITLIAILAASPLIAQDVYLGDLNYIQPPSKIMWDANLQHQKKTVDKSQETKTFLTAHDVSYSLSDLYNVGLKFEYAFLNERTNNGKNGVNNPGLSDITITNNFRMAYEVIFFDLFANLTLAPTEKENGTTTEDGTYNRGAHALNVGFATGNKGDAVEWRLGVDLEGAYERYYTDIGEENLENYQWPQLTLTAKTDFLFRLTQRFALGAGASMTYKGEAKYENEVYDSADTLQDSVYNEKGHVIWTLSSQALYNITANSLLKVGFSYTPKYSYDTYYKIDSPTMPSGINGEIKDTSVSNITVGGTFLF